MTYTKFNLHLGPKYLSENADCDTNQQWQNMFVYCLAWSRWSVTVLNSLNSTAYLWSSPWSLSIFFFFFNQFWPQFPILTLPLNIYIQVIQLWNLQDDDHVGNGVYSIKQYHLHPLTHLIHISKKDRVPIYFKLSEYKGKLLFTPIALSLNS